MSLVQFRDEAPYISLLRRLISIGKESETLSPSGSTFDLRLRDETPYFNLLMNTSVSEANNLGANAHVFVCRLSSVGRATDL